MVQDGVGGRKQELSGFFHEARGTGTVFQVLATQPAFDLSQL